jgi:trehalose/maltose hydrolase-like predicted phosphorylase
VIGLRVREIPLLNGVAVVNGFAVIHPVVHTECTPHAPYPLGGDIRVGEMRMSDISGCVRYVDQRYDFSCGELTSRFAFKARDATAEAEVTTFRSRTMPAVVAQRTTVTTDAACELELAAKVDPRTVPGRWCSRLTTLPGEEQAPVDGALEWESTGGLSRCGVAYMTECSDAAERTRAEWDDESPLVTTHRFEAVPGRSYALTQLVAMVPSTIHDQPHLAAIRLVAKAATAGFDHLRQENRAAWDELWRGRVNILGGDKRWQSLVDAAFFYLNSSVHPSSLASTHVFGLGQWHDYHYYYGHVMWDLEVFALPVLLLTQPHAARAMLDYRFRCLPAARHNAQLNGLRGLQFPWQSSPRFGQEAAPGGGDAAAHEHHITANVALAFARFAQASGDLEFERDRAWPVLAGAAEWIESRVASTARGYEIKQATGIAEREETHDNSAYVNLTARLALREAVACSQRLGKQAPPSWSRIADGLVVPMDRSGEVIVDHDDYDPKEEKGATPAVLAALFPAGYRAEAEVEEATIRFFLERADEYVGSPMLSALYGTWAARLGDRGLAAKLLEEGYGAFTSERFANVHEYRTDRFPDEPVSGPFVANLAGMLLNCYFGFTGLEISTDDPRTWPRRPVVMPAGWDGIEVESISVRGRAARLIACHGDPAARLEFHESE